MSRAAGQERGESGGRAAAGGAGGDGQGLRAGSPAGPVLSPFAAVLLTAAVVGLAPLAAVAARAAYDWSSASAQSGFVVPGSLERRELLESVLFFGTLYAAMIALTVGGLAAMGRNPAAVLGLSAPRDGSRTYIRAVVLTLLGSALLAGATLAWVPDQVWAETATYQELIQREHGWLLILVLGLLAPVAEEMLFRGVLFNGLARSRLGPWGAAIASSLVFAGLHADHSGPAQAILFGLGLWLSWLMIRHGSLRVPILAHATYNLALSLALLAAPPFG